jgi:transposase
MDYKDCFKHVLPENLLEYFDLKEIKLIEETDKRPEHYIILLEEKNVLPKEIKEPEHYESKGFYEARLVQDFPLRGKAVYLEIHRRRWIHKQKKTYIHRDFTLIAEGTKFTKELSSFLKQTNRY